MDIVDAIKTNIGDRNYEGQNKNLQLWNAWYKGYEKNFHKYYVLSSLKKLVERTRKHLPTAKFVCEKWANLLINEKTDVKMNANDKIILNKIFDRTHFWKKANHLVEKTFALGIGAFVVSVKGIQVDNVGNIVNIDAKKVNSKVKIECINAMKIYPITIEDGVVTECAFVSIGTQKSYITLHLIENGKYIIKTIYFRGKDFNDKLEETTFKTNSEVSWFQIIYPNTVDNEDVDDPLGIPVFANGIDVMKSIDVKYDVFDAEFKQGKKRTYISAALSRIDKETGDSIATLEGTEEEYFYVPQDESGNNLISTDASPLRTMDIITGINMDLSYFGYICGFGKDYLKFSTDSGSGRPLQTATSVISSQSELYQSIKKNEIVIEDALLGLVKAIIYASNTFTLDKFSDNAEEDIGIQFDDSIFEDKESEKDSARKDIALGIMSEKEYRVKFYAEDEDTANKMLLENPSYISKKINDFLPSLQAKVISPEVFIDLVFGDNYSGKNELVNYINENLSKGISAEEMMANGFGFGA